MKSYDNSRPSKYIRYLDANNLYVRAISQYLRYGRFKWLKPEKIDGFNVKICLVKVVRIDIY